MLCHTDLHEKQILCDGLALSALIDFGAATVLDRYWDLGSFYYFHGASNFASLHAAYAGCPGGDEIQVELVPHFSVAIALHHASRSRLPGKHHRLERAINHVRAVVTGAM